MQLHPVRCGKHLPIDIYSSISLNLLNYAIQYGSTITKISDSDEAIIKHSRKTLLFYDNQPWEKKSGDPDFDVDTGCYDGAEICELEGGILSFEQVK